MPDTFGLRAGDVAELCSLNCQSRAQVTDREADAAEATTKPSIEIKKTEMQPRRNFHGNGDRLGNAIVQAQSPKIVQLGGFFECEYGSTVRYPNSVGNRAGSQTILQEGASMTETKTERTYSDEEIQQRLKRDLPHWYLENGWIRRKYRTNSWKGTLMVINTVGHLAEAAWHHPDITASYAWVEVRLQNHAAKGITDKDFELAKKIEDVIQWQPGKDGGALEGTPEKDQRFAYLKYDS
jgi:4a-hydroxytetrahydrobiopterin dehydratase